MQQRKKHKNIHPFFVYTYIVFAIGFSVWLFSVANPRTVQADEAGSFNEIISEKDKITEQELFKTRRSNDYR